MRKIQYKSLDDWMLDIFGSINIPKEDARTISDHLVRSTLLGHDSHGIWRVIGYVSEMMEDYQVWDNHKVVRDGPCFAVIDGGGANGIVAVNKAVELAIQKAKDATFGFIGLRNVTHIGRLGDYPPRIAEHGMIGSVWLAGGGLFLAPFGSADRRLRPEPIAYAVPRKNGSPFMLDITMSVVAGGKFEQKAIREEPTPEGWMIDQSGNYVTDTPRFKDDDVGILPLGGLQFGHKGAGLAMMIEMIVGPLTGNGCVNSKTTWDNDKGSSVVLAIDIEKFTDLDTYTSDVEEMAEWIHSARPLPGFDKVYMPGEIEEETRDKRLKDGIEIPDNTWNALGELSNKLGVDIPNL